MRKTIVLSLGGSLIVPDKINYPFLNKCKKTLEKNYKTHKFVVVCGGGTIARKYITALREEGKSEKELSLAGIRATRMNARFMMQFFGRQANSVLPLNMEEVKDALPKNQVVFCGALRYAPKSTSDETGAKLARLLKTDFINITNVPGLYTDNPKENKKAKFIPKQTWAQFASRASKIKYKAGQHFVLDQRAANLIKKDKIKTYIIGQDLKNLNNALAGKKFKGTIIEG